MSINIKLSVILMISLTINSYAQTWPILQEDDENHYYIISGEFGEIHPEGGIPPNNYPDHFHRAIDINIDANVAVHPILNGTVNFVGSQSVIVVSELQNGIYQQSVKYLHINPNVSNGDVVTEGTILGYSQNTNSHLHLEIRIWDENQYVAVSPLNNNSGTQLTLPTDHEDDYDPQINNVLIEPLNSQPNNVPSGCISIDPNNLNGAEPFNDTYYNVHFNDITINNLSVGPRYEYPNEKMVVWGNIGFIINCRDRGVNSPPGNGNTTHGGGPGLTVASVSYAWVSPEEVEFQKYAIEFLEIPHAQRNQINQLFRVPYFPEQMPDSYLYGNHDFIELRSTNDTYLSVHQEIDDIQSNGIWFTKADENTPHVFNQTPTQVAAANEFTLYPDGEHTLRFYVEDASNQDDDEDLHLIVDNFLPFIDQVKITQSWQEKGSKVNVTLYVSDWIFDDGLPSHYNLSALQTHAGKTDSDISFEFTASEPLASCDLSYVLSGQNSVTTIDQVAVNDEQTIWNFILQTNELPQAGEYNLQIEGQDMAGNSLQANPHVIPIRMSETEWEPEPSPGIDEFHSFAISTYTVAFTLNTDLIPAGEESVLTIINLTSGYSEFDYTWEWTFGGAETYPSNYDGMNPPPIIFHSGNNPGIYDIQLQIIDGRQVVAELIKTIEIFNPDTYILADFEAQSITDDGELYGNSPLTVQFTDATSGNPDTWQWDFGDITGNSSEQSPQYTFFNNSNEPQHYTITLEACNSSSNCSGEMKESFITVYPENTSLDPLADFTYTQTSLFAPCTVTLFNTSSGDIDTYEWDLDGDGSYDDSNLENPAPVVIDDAGNHSISLKVTNTTTQEFDIYTIDLIIYQNSYSGYTVDFAYLPQNPVQGELVHFNENVVGFYYSYNCVWKINGPGIYYQESYLNNPSLTFFESGIYNVYLEAYDFYGNFLGVCSKQVMVNPPGMTTAPDEISIEEYASHWAKFGKDVDIDGDFAVVAAPEYFDKGAVFIYKYDHLTQGWSLFQGPLLPDVHENDQFARSVSISGNYIAVGAPHQTNNGQERTGAVYIYKYNGSSWISQPNKLVPADAGFNDYCGFDLDMDGNYLVIGTGGGVTFPDNDSLPEYKRNRDHPGKAYIYKNENGTWMEKCKIFDENGYVNDGFGVFVSISNNRIAVGSEGGTSGGHGEAYIFSRVNDEYWEQFTIDVGYNGDNWTTVSICNNTLLIGQRRGNVQIYSYQNGVWLLDQVLEEQLDSFSAYGISLSCVDNYAFVGAPGEDLQEQGEGAVYIYRRVGDFWQLIDKITPNIVGNGIYVRTSFGYSIGTNSEHVIIGRPGCFIYAPFYCNPSPPNDFPGAITFLSNYIYPCDRVIQEDNYHPDPGTYPENSAGYITLGGNPANEVYFQDGVDIAYNGSDILLLDGFTAAEGSDFTARGMLCSSPPVLTSGDFYPVKEEDEFKEDAITGEKIESTISVEQNILIYPNPTDGILTIETVIPDIAISEISLFDIYGKKVLVKETQSSQDSEMKTSIFIGNLNKGIYLLTITTEDRVFTEKVILQ